MTYRHYQSLLPAILFILSACEPFQTIITHPAESDLTQVPAIVNPSLTPSVSQEPDWYQPLVPLDQPLEYQYALVTDPQVKVYIRLQDAENDTLQYSRLPIIPGYVAYVGIERQGDDAFYHLASGGWIKEEDLQEITPSSFAGILLAEEIDFRFGWLISDSTSRDANGSAVQPYQRYQVIREFPSLDSKAGYISIGQNEWLPEESATLIDPGLPDGLRPGICRFIHVDLARQTLSAYDNCRIVFATLVSSGQEDLHTSPGEYAVIHKMEYRTLDSIPGARDKYYLENVPYFMTYFGNLGIHGVYWHDQFGSPVSHGCINLSVTDARWLYDWVILGNVLLITDGE